MVRVVELITTLNTGGAESMIRDYCLLLNREIIDVKVVVMAERMNSAIEKRLSETGVDVVYLGEHIYPGDKALNIFQKVMRFIGAVSAPAAKKGSSLRRRCCRGRSKAADVRIMPMI